MEQLTIKQAVEKCKELREKTNQDWYFEANKGTIKLVCGDYQDTGWKIRNTR